MTLQGAGARGLWSFPGINGALRPHSAISDLHQVSTGLGYQSKSLLFRDTSLFCRCLCAFLLGEHHPSFINAQQRHKEVKGPDEGDSKSNCLEFCSSETPSL